MVGVLSSAARMPFPGATSASAVLAIVSMLAMVSTSTAIHLVRSAASAA